MPPVPDSHSLTPDEAYLRRAIALAMNGRGRVEPNPMVGCVLVRPAYGDVAAEVVGEGYHTHVGGPHAEPSAIADAAQRGNPLEGTTAYVTLEPCCHTNKRTPPCVPALLKARVARVVVGTLDPNPEVNGKGVAQLEQAGVAVRVGVLEPSARQLLAPFVALTSLKRPYVTLKWAQSADGKIGGPGGARRDISSPESLAVVHRLRARCDAILIGGQTLRADNPFLTARPADGTVKAEWISKRPPLLRAVVTTAKSLPPESHLFTTPDAGPVVVYAAHKSFAPLNAKNVETVKITTLKDVLDDLARRGTAHLLVESGGRLAEALADVHLADRAWAFTSPRPLPEEGPQAADLPWLPAARSTLGGDGVVELFNPKSPAFFSPEPSADWLQLMPTP